MVHDGIRCGGIEEAERRCQLIARELDETSALLALTAATLESELV
jgi:hypothetical protein